MTIPIVPTVTDELIEELESAAEYCVTQVIRSHTWRDMDFDLLGADERYVRAASPELMVALLAERANLKQQLADKEAHAANLTGSETLLFNYLADIRRAVGDDGRLTLPGLVEYINGMSRQLAAASVDAERYQKLCTVTPYRFKKIQDGALTDGGDCLYFHSDRFDAAIDATRNPSSD